MKTKYLPLYLFFLFLSSSSWPQLTEAEEELIAPSISLDTDLNYSIDFNVIGLASSGEDLPFWLYHNRRGRLSEDSNYAAWATGKHVIFFTPESYLISGAGILYQDGRKEGVKLDEAFLHFQNTWMYATLGRKQRPEVYNGLSASNTSLLWSLNARPLPGFEFGTTEPLFLFSEEEEGFGVEASWGEYLLGNDRYVEGARLHHKNLRLVYRRGSWQVKAGLQHFAQWAGISPRVGQQPKSLDDYLRVITWQKGGADATEGDQLLALGNHLGGWEFFVNKEFRTFDVEFFYNHIFEDGSGRMLRNTPDGRYGIFVEAEEKDRLINSVLYEFIYTEHQSHSFPSIHRYDNYFNSGVYRSGWTYEDRVIGAPFFTENPNGLGIINNKFKAHHLGIGGQFRNISYVFPYRLLLSYAHNDGTYFRRYRPKQDVGYGLFDIRVISRAIDLNLQFGMEYNSYTAPLYGGGFQLRYEL